MPQNRKESLPSYSVNRTSPKSIFLKSDAQHPNAANDLQTILVVEDDKISQKLATMLLEKEGYQVLLAKTGVEALQILKQNHIDLILMDITMPDMDGLEAAAQIRDNEYGTKHHIPIIALTANALKIDRDKGFEVGMDAYITKPFHAREMFETISTVLQKRHEAKLAPPASADTLKAPVATQRPKTVAIHDDVRIDNYFWLREKEDPEVLAYLEEENAYTKAKTAHTTELQDTLYQEMRGRIQETDLSVPEKVDSIYYYSRTEDGQQYSIYCRRHESMQGPEEIILDENQLAKGHDYFRIGGVAISPNHRYMAYMVDTDGSEFYTLYIKDLESNKVLADSANNLSYGLEWGNDNQTLFYVTQDSAMRPSKLIRHQLGDGSAADVVLHHETDEAFFLGLHKTKSKSYLFLSLNSNVTSEVWFIPADSPERAPQLIEAREQDIEYDVDHHADRFIITTNDKATNFRVLIAPVDSPSKENWRELIPHSEEVKLDRVEPFRDYLVIYEREAGLRQIRIRDIKTGEDHRIEFPDPVYTFYGSSNPNFDAEQLRFTYTSLATPQTVYDYHMTDRSWALLKQKPVLGGYDATLYESERLFATAPDGMQIPISLIRRKDAVKDAVNDKLAPTLLYGYGSYGVSVDPAFNSTRISLLDRGVTFAIAHVRGSGTMGRHWYEGGKLLHKKNTFTDFVACAQHLVADGYTTPDKLVATGRSAGGLLMGAITNMRPDLFAGIVAGVPFVDAINTMLDASIPLTVIEYEEWGNPNDPEFYEYIKSYSPYDNVEAKAYPTILATAGLNDPRVQYWEPAKWVAKLREVKTDENVLLLKTNMGAGHGGASGRFDYLEEVAFEYAFMLDVWGLA